MVYGDVSLHRHGTDDAESGQRKEQQGKSKVLAQRVLPGPRPLHVGGDGDRAGQEGSEEVCDRQATHQRVKRGFLLFLAGFTKNHDGDDIADHPENEHYGRDGGNHGPPCHRLVIHDWVWARGEIAGTVRLRQEKETVSKPERPAGEVRSMWPPVMVRRQVLSCGIRSTGRTDGGAHEAADFIQDLAFQLPAGLRPSPSPAASPVWRHHDFRWEALGSKTNCYDSKKTTTTKTNKHMWEKDDSLWGGKGSGKHIIST